MIKIRCFLALLIVTTFCVDTGPASAQVMKNFSWKKKAKRPTPTAQDAASMKSATDQTRQRQSGPKRRKQEPGN